MSTAYWNRVRSDEMTVPTDRPLPDLTAELTTMLGSVDPVERDEIAYPILATWVSEGVVRRPARRARRRHGRRARPRSRRVRAPTRCSGAASPRSCWPSASPATTPSRCCRRARSWSGATGSAAGWCASATCAGSCPARAGPTRSPTGPTRSACWPSRRTSASTSSPCVLDVLADRVIEETPAPLTSGEPDRLARATMSVLRRRLVPLRIIEPWLARVAAAATRPHPGRPRPLPDHRQPRGLPAGAPPPGGPRARADRRTLRPAADDHGRPAHHQRRLPRRPSLTSGDRSVTCPS